MIRSVLTRALGILIASSCLAAHATTSPADPCGDPLEASHSSVVFDHLAGRIISETPVVLDLSDGEVFQVIFCKTYPQQFDYEITPIEVAKEDQTSFDGGDKRAVVDQNHLSTYSVSRKHKDSYSLYKVTVTVKKEAANPEVGTTERHQAATNAREMMMMGEKPNLADSLGLERQPTQQQVQDLSDYEILRNMETSGEPVPEPIYLYSYSFPIWVKTVAWDLSFTTGVAFSDLTNDKFFIETDTKDTPETADDTKLVRRSSRDVGDSRPDLVLFANLRTPDAGWWGRNWLGGRGGLAFGLGLNGDGDPRYFFGPSWTIGRKDHFVLMAGWTGGQVDRLPSGQEVDVPPLNDNILTNLDSSFEHGFFAGLTFSFNGRNENDFVTALNGQAGRTDTESQENK